MEASYHINGARQAVKPERGEQLYGRGSMVSSVDFERADKPYAMLRCPWAEARAALPALAGNRPDQASVQITCTNPETGRDAQNILGYCAQMLRPGHTVQLPVRSPAMVFHLIEGAAEVRIADQQFVLTEADTFCAPGNNAITLINRSATAPAFFFIADESPLHGKLGVFEVRV